VPRHLYLPGPLRGVFNVQALGGAPEIILCEALLDALLTAAVPIGPGPAPRRPPSIAPPPASAVEATPASSLPPLPHETLTLMEPTLSLAADPASIANTGDVTPLPEAASPTAPPGPNVDDLGVTLGDREYRVRGLGRNLSYDSLKVTLRVARGGRLYLDTLDLYAARQRAGFVRQAAEELELAPEILKGDLATLLITCEQRQDQLIRAALTPTPKTIELTDAERTAALELLTRRQRTCGTVWAPVSGAAW
jgi:hypothetical protein